MEMRNLWVALPSYTLDSPATWKLTLDSFSTFTNNFECSTIYWIIVSHKEGNYNSETQQFQSERHDSLVTQHWGLFNGQCTPYSPQYHTVSFPASPTSFLLDCYSTLSSLKILLILSRSRKPGPSMSQDFPPKRIVVGLFVCFYSELLYEKFQIYKNYKEQDSYQPHIIQFRYNSC